MAIVLTPLPAIMEPFDYAWHLLKAPLLPETIQHTGTNDGVDEYTAQFLHPVTGEIYPMQGHTSDDDGHVSIRRPDKPLPVAEAGFSPLQMPEDQFGIEGDERSLQDWTGSPYIEDRDPFGHHHDETEPPPYADTGYGGTGVKEPPVGMGTAMYDLAAHMANKRGVKIVPSNYQTVNAANMWAKHRDKGHWPPPAI